MNRNLAAATERGVADNVLNYLIGSANELHVIGVSRHN